MTEEEFASLQAKAAKADELEAELAEEKAARSKLEGKNLNFEELRKTSKEAREQILSKYDQEKRAMIEEIESIRRRDEERDRKSIKEAEEAALAEIDGDADFKKSVQEQAKEFIGEPRTPEEAYNRIKKSWAIARDVQPSATPFGKFAPSTSYTPATDHKKDFVKTPEGQATFKALFGRAPKIQ